MSSRQEPPFLLDTKTLSEAAELYGRLFPDRLESVVRDAERVCDGIFSFLGIEFQADALIDWQRDPNTRRNWPSRFYADVRIPFCDGNNNLRVAGDPKHVWELNRHEFLINCAKAYFLTREIRFARRVFQIMTDWIDGNPYLQGVNWASPLEVSLRSMSWLWAYQFSRSWDGLTAATHLQLVKAFYQHAIYLDRHLEIYSSPNNHLVGEATALYLLGSFFPEFDRSAAWRDRAWTILEQEPDRQFDDDGGSTEQATSYHHYCLGFFVLAMLTRIRQGMNVPPSMLKRLEAAFAFSMWMTMPNGTVPRIGDTDDARSIRFGPVIPWDFRDLLSLGAVMFQRGDMKAVAGAFSEDALWLLGSEGLRSFQALPSFAPSEISRVFPYSGYTILRSGWDKTSHFACFDCGDIGLGLRVDDVPIFTHGHADMLSLNICAFGEPLLVDAGFYTYNGSPEWHHYTREVQAHNTVRVDGQSQAKFNSRNAWSCVSRPGPILRKSFDQVEIVQGSHSGFYRVKDCARHHRTVAWDRKSCWLIRDVLEGRGSHFVEVFFHFPPARVRVLPDGAGVSVTTDGGVHAVLQSLQTDSLQIEARCGEREPDGGWIATSYGCKQAAPVIRFHGQVQFPCSMTFLLSSSLVEMVPLVVEQVNAVDAPGEGLVPSTGLRVLASDGEELLALRCQADFCTPLTDICMAPLRSQLNDRGVSRKPLSASARPLSPTTV